MIGGPITVSEAIVKREDVPAMTLCSICPNPGRCCNGFYLYRKDSGTEVTVWKDKLGEFTSEHAPFEAEVQATFKVEDVKDANFGREYLRVYWRCPKLVAGRCSIYQDRPQICRDFMPGNISPLCVFHPQHHEVMAAV